MLEDNELKNATADAEETERKTEETVSEEVLAAAEIESPAEETVSAENTVISEEKIENEAASGEDIYHPVTVTAPERPAEPVYQAGRVYSPEAPEGAPYYQHPDFVRAEDGPFRDGQVGRQHRKKKGISWFSALALFLAVVLLAGAGGFGGAYLFSRMNGKPNMPTEKSVLYQSVLRTADEKDDEGGKLTVSDVANIAAPSVVEIVTESVAYGTFFGQYTTSGAGSGVILSEDGLIVTNHHVIEDASNITVKLKTGEDYPAELVGTDDENDIALIRIKAEGLQAAVLGSSEGLVVGEGVIAVGNPLGELGGTVTDGIISALDREIEIGGKDYTLLQTNAAVNPGNSGGGLFNMYGELIGIVNAKINENSVEGLGFAIPIDHAKGIIEELATYGYVRGRIDLGMQFIEINDAKTALYYNVSESGVYIASVENTSYGFNPGDLILSVNGEEIITMEDFEKAIGEHKVGDSLAVQVKRRVGRNQYETLDLTWVLREKVPAYIQH